MKQRSREAREKRLVPSLALETLHLKQGKLVLSENQHGTSKKLEVWKMIFLFKQVIFRFHVDFSRFYRFYTHPPENDPPWTRREFPFNKHVQVLYFRLNFGRCICLLNIACFYNISIQSQIFELPNWFEAEQQEQDQTRTRIIKRSWVNTEVWFV